MNDHLIAAIDERILETEKAIAESRSIKPIDYQIRVLEKLTDELILYRTKKTKLLAQQCRDEAANAIARRFRENDYQGVELEFINGWMKVIDFCNKILELGNA